MENHNSSTDSECEQPQGSLQSMISGFNRGGLRPTQTIERHLPVVQGKPQPINNPLEDDELREYFDTPDQLEAEAKEFANFLRSSKHCVVYTGAGISTSAKIPDYRGPQGVWTMQAKGLVPKIEIDLSQALPTYAHMALVELMRHGLLKYVISTNVDGLHRRSGIPEDQISELHGNIYREVCTVCQAEYLRPFDVRAGLRQRYTGRLCTADKKKQLWSEEERARFDTEGSTPICRGKLMDSIINFGETLPKESLKRAELESDRADLTLVIGSSMRVVPACELPARSYVRGGRFCICNLQKTPFEKEVTKSKGLRIFARSDEFMRLVMKELGIEVPAFNLDAERLNVELGNIIPDPDFERSCRYRMSSMADDGPPPAAVLAEILARSMIRQMAASSSSSS